MKVICYLYSLYSYYSLLNLNMPYIVQFTNWTYPQYMLTNCRLYRSYTEQYMLLLNRSVSTMPILYYPNRSIVLCFYCRIIPYLGNCLHQLQPSEQLQGIGLGRQQQYSVYLQEDSTIYSPFTTLYVNVYVSTMSFVTYITDLSYVLLFLNSNNRTQKYCLTHSLPFLSTTS